jgi:predicted DNA-binding transcriptional regulator YafY
MAVRRRGRFSLKEDRRLIQMAAESVTLEEAAAAFGSSVATIERMARKLGLPLKGRDSHQKRFSARAADVGLKAKGK